MIESYIVVKIHDKEPRVPARKCSECGKRRLTTRISMKNELTCEPHTIHLCNECLTRTRPS